MANVFVNGIDSGSALGYVFSESSPMSSFAVEDGVVTEMLVTRNPRRFVVRIVNVTAATAAAIASSVERGQPVILTGSFLPSEALSGLARGATGRIGVLGSGYVDVEYEVGTGSSEFEFFDVSDQLGFVGSVTPQGAAGFGEDVAELLPAAWTATTKKMVAAGDGATDVVDLVLFAAATGTYQVEITLG